MAVQTTDGVRDFDPPTVNGLAPDFTLTNTAGEPVALSTLWGKSPLIVVFLRHYGCTFCREQVLLLKRDYEKIVASGVRVVCVAMGPYKAGRAFQILFDLPFDVLATGEDITPFRAYGLGRASLKDILNPVVWWRIFMRTFRGIINNPFKAQGDVTQMQGSYVIDTDGRFLFTAPASRVYQVDDPLTLLAATSRRQSAHA